MAHASNTLTFTADVTHALHKTLCYIQSQTNGFPDLAGQGCWLQATKELFGLVLWSQSPWSTMSWVSSCRHTCSAILSPPPQAAEQRDRESGGRSAGGGRRRLTLVPRVSGAPAGGPVPPAHPALVQHLLGLQLEVAVHLLALPGQAERHPSLAAPGAVLHPVQEAVQETAPRLTVQTAGRLGQLGAPPQVVLPLQGPVVVEGALLVPPGAGVGGAGQEAAGSPRHLAVLAAGERGEAEAAPGLESLAAGPGAGRPGGPGAPAGAGGAVQDGPQQEEQLGGGAVRSDRCVYSS